MVEGRGQVKVVEAPCEIQRVQGGFCSRLLEMRRDVAPRERAAELGKVPADARARSAAHRPVHQHARAFVGLLHDDVVDLSARCEPHLDGAADERFGRAHVPLDDPRAGVAAGAHEDLRKHRARLARTRGPDHLQRRIERNAFGHLEIRAAILKSGRERDEAVRTRRNQPPGKRAHALRRIALLVGERRNDRAPVAVPFRGLQVRAADVDDAARVLDGERRRVRLGAVAGAARCPRRMLGQRRHGDSATRPAQLGEIELRVLMAPARRERLAAPSELHVGLERLAPDVGIDCASARRTERLQLVEGGLQHRGGRGEVQALRVHAEARFAARPFRSRLARSLPAMVIRRAA